MSWGHGALPAWGSEYGPPQNLVERIFSQVDIFTWALYSVLGYISLYLQTNEFKAAISWTQQSQHIVSRERRRIVENRAGCLFAQEGTEYKIFCRSAHLQALNCNRHGLRIRGWAQKRRKGRFGILGTTKIFKLSWLAIWWRRKTDNKSTNRLFVKKWMFWAS